MHRSVKILSHGSRELRSMRKQIVRGFHSFKGKINSVLNQSEESEQREELIRAEKAGSGEQDVYGAGQDAHGAGRDAHGARQDVFDRLMERRAFEKIVDEKLRAGHGQGCLLVGDVDRFREVCDIYGQDMGSDVLRRVVDVLFGTFAKPAFMTRQGRDTFVMWLPGVSDTHADLLRRQAGEVNDILLHPAGEFPPVTLSIGMAFGDEAEDCRSLGKIAVKALNHVKERGRCGCEIDDGNRR